MPASELQDFQMYWRQSMLDDDGKPRPSGGTKTTVEGVSGVDYEKFLIPWSKGNSPSFDMTTMRRSIFLLGLLVERLRLMLRAQDLGRSSSMHSAGLTAKDLEINMGKHLGAGRQLGKTNPKWLELEGILDSLLLANHIKLFKTSNEYAEEQEAVIKSYLKTKSLTDNDMTKGICQFLLINANNGAHVRLHREFGWETFVRDYMGAPYGVPGVIAGSLKEDIPKDLIPTMPIPLHHCFAETIAKSVAKRGDIWGKNQLKVRKEIADAAKPDGSGIVDRISLDDFYRIFAEQGVLHMAETVLQSSKSNNASAKFDLEELPGSYPKKWDVKIDPFLIRWRELQRDREISRGLDDEEEEGDIE